MKSHLLFFLCLSLSVFTLTSCGDDDGMTPGPGPTETDEELAQAALSAAFEGGGNATTDPAFTSGTITPTTDLGSNLSTAPAGLVNAAYKGAVDPSATSPWFAGWSFYSRIVAGNMNSDPLPIASFQTISDDGSGTGTGMPKSGSGENAKTESHSRTSSVSAVRRTLAQPMV